MAGCCFSSWYCDQMNVNANSFQMLPTHFYTTSQDIGRAVGAWFCTGTTWKVGRTVENYHCIGNIFFAMLHSISVSTESADSQGHACLNFFFSRLRLRHRMHRPFFSRLLAFIWRSNETQNLSGFCDALHTHTPAIDPLRYDRVSGHFKTVH